MGNTNRLPKELGSETSANPKWIAPTNERKPKPQYAVNNAPTTFLSSANPLKPNDPYRGRTAPLTSKRYILYIYSTNIGTE